MQLATDLTDYAAGALGLVEMASSFLNDRTRKMWSKGELIAWINEAQLALAAKINQLHREHFLKFDDSTSPGAGTAYYSLPADLVKLMGIDVLESSTDRDPQNLVAIPMTDHRFYEALDQAQDKNGYRFFFVAGTQFKTIPEPAAVSGEKFRFHYVKRLAPLVNNTDVSEIPVQHHVLLAMDGARLALVKTKQVNAQIEIMRTERLNDMMGEIEKYTPVREEVVEPFHGSYGPHFLPDWPVPGS